MTLRLEQFSIHQKPNQPLFFAITLEIKPGEILTLMGPSGCGKSTLLDAIAGHLSNTFTECGSIYLDGQPLHQYEAHKREIGVLFQDDLLFPHLNVWENLAFALPNAVKKLQRKTRAMAALEQLSLSTLANAYPDEISGGQRARISLVRTLLANPKAILLDEPFGKLDEKLRAQFRSWVFSQIETAQIPALMVTHDKQDIPPNGRVLHWPWNETIGSTAAKNKNEAKTAAVLC